MKYFFILLIAFLFPRLMNAQSEVSITHMQQRLVAKMTGKAEAEPSVFIHDRSSKEQRRKSVVLLMEALEEIGLEPEIHSYRYPNVNAFVDLLFDPFRGVNVYAVIPSTEPDDEYIILGAHYDSEPCAPGADDNGSGVALVHAVGYELSKLETRTINFMLVFFDQEENDEVGSKAFVKMVKKEGMNIHSVHIADMVGWDSDGDYAVELSPKNSRLIKHYEKAALNLKIPVFTTNVMSSDHKSFYDEGYSTVLITEEYQNGDFNPYYHSEKDTYDRINFPYLLSCTQLVTAIMKEYATQNR
ncbi:MAG: M28 family peptidase [Cyclobacteriaceae bacterium]